MVNLQFSVSMDSVPRSDAPVDRTPGLLCNPLKPEGLNQRSAWEHEAVKVVLTKPDPARPSWWHKPPGVRTPL